MTIIYPVSISPRARIMLFISFLLISIVFLSGAVRAEGANQHLITIHEGDAVRSIISNKDTLREAFADAHITIDPADKIEPSVDKKLVSNDYQVNIYRARPVTIVDGVHQIRVMTAYQTPKQIAKDAGVELRAEDKTDISFPEDMVADGASLRMVIERAVLINLELYGKKEPVYTRASTVDAFLKEKKIILQGNDRASLSGATPITENMTLQIWREGKQTITQDEAIEPPVETIKDANQPAGYEKVNEPGTPGRKSVTYEIVMKNGQEVSRTTIQSVVIDQPVKKVITVGVKPSFDGDFAAALAKLRSCEGSYTSWNPAGPYYGAYQFNRGTWGSVADPSKYGNASPAEQDEAARKLYERRGWSPWPNCGANLPDTYR